MKAHAVKYLRAPAQTLAPAIDLAEADRMAQTYLGMAGYIEKGETTEADHKLLTELKDVAVKARELRGALAHVVDLLND